MVTESGGSVEMDIFLHFLDIFFFLEELRFQPHIRFKKKYSLFIRIIMIFL